MKVKIGTGAAVAVVIVPLALSGVDKEQKKAMGVDREASPTIVKAQNPVKGDIRLTIGLTGAVEPSDFVYVYAKAFSDVASVLVKSGDMVEQGQMLCEIDTERVETSKSSMDTAFISPSEAQSNLSRMQILCNSGSLSDQEHKQYSNRVKLVRLQYESAKLTHEKQIKCSIVTAPISGEIESCNIEVHDRVSQSAQLCVITREGEKRVSLYVMERVVGNIASGDVLDIRRDGVTYQANISKTSFMMDSDTNPFRVKAGPRGADGIATGSAVKLSLVMEYTEDTMTTLVDTVYYSDGDRYVYLYKDGITQMVQVEVGLYSSEKAEILSSISEDDMVAGIWSSNLYEGARVQLREESGQAQGSSADQAEQGGIPWDLQDLH